MEQMPTSLKRRQMMFVPGVNDHNQFMIIHIIERVDTDYSFITCNSGTGLEYHPSTAADCDKAPPKNKYKTCIRINDIPSERILDMGFWAIFFSLWMKKEPASEYHRVEVIYDVLLPWLAELTGKI